MGGSLDCSPIGQAGALDIVAAGAGAGAAAAGSLSASTASVLLFGLAAAFHVALRWSEAVRRQHVPLATLLRLCYLALLVRAVPVQLLPAGEQLPSGWRLGLAAVRIVSCLSYEVGFVLRGVCMARRVSVHRLQPCPWHLRAGRRPDSCSPPTLIMSSALARAPQHPQSLLLAASAALLPLPLWCHLLVHALGLHSLLARMPRLACLHASAAGRSAECCRFVGAARTAAHALAPGLPGALPKPAHAADCCWMQAGCFAHGSSLVVSHRLALPPNSTCRRCMGLARDPLALVFCTCCIPGSSWPAAACRLADCFCE